MTQTIERGGQRVILTDHMVQMVANTDTLGHILEAEARARRRRHAVEFLGDLRPAERRIMADFVPRELLYIDDRLRQIMMVATPANAYTDQLTYLTGNTGGAVQTLPQADLFGAAEKVQLGRLTLASQTYTGPQTVIAIARLPLFATPLDIELITDTSLGSSTLAFGDAGSGNAAIYGAAATLTSTNTKTRFGLPTATFGLELSQGYDSVSGLSTQAAMPQVAATGGFNFEDIIATVAVANLPASGNLVFSTKYLGPI